jgi:hypothetical protein
MVRWLPSFGCRFSRLKKRELGGSTPPGPTSEVIRPLEATASGGLLFCDLGRVSCSFSFSGEQITYASMKEIGPAFIRVDVVTDRLREQSPFE